MNLKNLIFLMYGCYSSELSRRYTNGSTVEKMYPFMCKIAVGYYNEVCGAVMLGDDLVLTAASCVERKDRNYMVHKTSYRALTRNTTDYYNATVFVHPEYNGNPVFDNIAVLRLLDSKAKGNLKLSNKNELSLIDKSFTAFGWGFRKCRRRFCLPAAFLQQATLNVIDPKNCTSFYSQDDKFIGFREDSNSQLCVGPTKVENIGKTEEGPRGIDIGGPLIEFDDNDTPLLIGIAAYNSCSVDGCKPSLFTSVNYYRDWIKSFMKDRSSNDIMAQLKERLV